MAHEILRIFAQLKTENQEQIRMTKERPLILITNDDGYLAKGINELVNSLRDLGDLVVFAPDGPRSGMSSAITSLIPIKYALVREEPGLTVYRCTGTPVDCVKLAINVNASRIFWCRVLIMVVTWRFA